jgi:O-antigen/teichoic acid export membrane protein
MLLPGRRACAREGAHDSGSGAALAGHLIGHSPDQAKTLAGLTVLVMASIGISFGLMIWIAAPWLVALFFGAGYEPVVAVMRVMAAIVPLIVLNSALVSQWLIPYGLDRRLNVVIFSGTAVNLVLALLLAPRFGAYGMAWVTVVVEGYLLVGFLLMLRRAGLRPIRLGLLRTGFAWLAEARR